MVYKYERTSYPKICEICQLPFSGHRPKQKFCSLKCDQQDRYEKWIARWKKGEEKGYRGKTLAICNQIRRYLFEKFNHRCCECEWNKKHPITGRIPLEVEHINGDASDCREENLKLLCPNCHSLTSTFRALNRNSKRKR